ncbi:unnamed protein product [Acanthoscelides obtectus]|uniref:Uncharacterized protein n=1 Tax=Acanthoscelides obtectus TaxID=200917 RepID=A0A9P0LVV0_ACAOB|nr:unnamed protein product [Acanthoscelides obtectus]CAK1677940.1 hypothetical protein AOBTE_LOCUS31661 [Acanthoscelides obtectus]
MEYPRIWLILSIGISAIVAINAVKCFDCVAQAVRGDKCGERQNRSTSYYFDCATLTPESGDNYSCARLEYKQVYNQSHHR